MKRIFHHLTWLLKGVKVFALIGKSGTGKSFRAKLITRKYGIELLIDDGLLIKDQKIIAGKSAKKEKAFLGAIKTALFDDKQHRLEVLHKLEREKFKRILIIGTSFKMVKKITERLKLPSVSKIINIEEIATREEMETAALSRKIEGKHVIPVPAIEVHQNYSHIMYDTVKVFLKKTFLPKSARYFEKAVVRPEFSRRGRVMISESALTQMVLHCADEFDDAIIVRKVSVRYDSHGYKIGVFIHVPYGIQLSGNLHNFQQYIIENLERFTGILIEKVNITIDNVSNS